MEKKERPITNRNLASLFFFFSMLLFLIYLIRQSLVTAITSLICLIISGNLKTWDVIRDTTDGYK